MDRIKEKLSAVGNAIREKTGKSELLNLDEMPAEIAAIETGIKTDDATAVAGDILSGKTAYVNDVKVTGTIPSKAAATITPSTSNQTIAAGTYLSGTQTIAGDADLVAGNIKKGVNIFGVDGNYEGAELNFEVVGGTEEPTNVSENTIWVGTDVDITSWIFSAIKPTAPTEGMVWISIGTSSPAAFNALEKNDLQLYPHSAKQYINGAWVDKTAKSWQGGEWVDWILNIVLLDSNGFLSPFAKTGGNAYTSTVTVGSNYFTIYVNHSSNGAHKYTWGAFNEKFDLTNYSTLKFTVSSATIPNDNCACSMGVSTTNSDTSYNAVKTFTTTGTYTIDISNLKGEYYIKGQAHYYSPSQVSFTVNYVELLK